MHGDSASAWPWPACWVRARCPHRRRCLSMCGSGRRRPRAMSGFPHCLQAMCGRRGTGNCRVDATSGALAIGCVADRVITGASRGGCTGPVVGRCAKAAGTVAVIASTPAHAGRHATASAVEPLLQHKQAGHAPACFSEAAQATNGISNRRAASSRRKPSNAWAIASAPRAVFCSRIPST